jgi:hypothetical protein
VGGVCKKNVMMWLFSEFKVQNSTRRRRQKNGRESFLARPLDERSGNGNENSKARSTHIMLINGHF